MKSSNKAKLIIVRESIAAFIESRLSFTKKSIQCLLNNLLFQRQINFFAKIYICC